MNIAVTGGLGSGKSTVSKILASYLQCGLLDTDQLCRQQLRPGCEGMVRLEERYGDRFFYPDGTLDRQSLRSATFEDHSVKVQLENILHPIVRIIVATHLTPRFNYVFDTDYTSRLLRLGQGNIYCLYPVILLGEKIV